MKKRIGFVAVCVAFCIVLMACAHDTGDFSIELNTPLPTMQQAVQENENAGGKEQLVKKAVQQLVRNTLQKTGKQLL